jgi:hypothetical protein
MAAEDIKSSLMDKLKVLSQNAWEGRIDGRDIERWLSQFNSASDVDADEQLQMLFLLSNFIYFGAREIRALLRSLYRDLYKYKIVRSIRDGNAHTTDRGFIKQKFDEELLATRFFGIGNPSESGTHLLYYFRQENSLGKMFFANTHEIFSRDQQDPTRQVIRDHNIKNYVFIDDVCGSGTQAEQYSRDILEPLKALNPDARVCYYVLFATAFGLEQIRNNTRFDDVAAVYELDETFRCFGPQSRVFAKAKPPIDRAKAQDIATKYGAVLWPPYPLGYKDGQLLLGLNHNTPDNTLPIFWFDEPQGPPWTPIFRRYPKWYGWQS